jgi:hypothetical protein
VGFCDACGQPGEQGANFCWACGTAAAKREGAGDPGRDQSLDDTPVLGTLGAYAPFGGLFHDFHASSAEDQDDPYARFFAPRRDDRSDSQQRDGRVHGGRRGQRRRKAGRSAEAAAAGPDGGAVRRHGGTQAPPHRNRGPAGDSGSPHGFGRGPGDYPPPDYAASHGHGAAPWESTPPEGYGGAGRRSGAPRGYQPGSRDSGPLLSNAAAGADSGPLENYLWTRRFPVGPARRKRFVGAVLAVVVLVAGGGVILGYQMYRDHPAATTSPAAQRDGAPRSAAQSRPQSRPQSAPPTAQRTAPPTAPPTARPTAPPTGPPVPPSAAQLGNSTVAVAPALAGVPQARAIVSFLTSYFRAVNAHDYVAYRRLLDPAMQSDVTAARFVSGYRSTVDSAATLTGISRAADGRRAADVMFTSHQAPADGPGSTACTNWSVTLFLEHADSGYLISEPPASYRPSYQAC